MEGTFGLIQDMLRAATENNSAGFITLAAFKLNEFVLSDHDFLDERGGTEDLLVTFRLVESGNDFGTCGHSQTFDAFEVGVLDDHHPHVCE
jgi:hypothetical protein